MSIRHWLQLAITEGIGPILSRRIIDRSGGVEPACRADVKLLREIEGLGVAKATKICQAIREAATRVDAELARAAAAGVRLVCPDDEVYPVLLRSIPDPPVVLYVKGTLEPRDLNALGIVGSRRCSHYGREQAERFASLLAGSGFTVISGGARGVDSAAHRGALAQPQGRTIAVLGSGVDTPYPPENAGLFDQIARRGAVVSEFPLGTPPTPENFPRRNRIVSGMSRGVMVVEADLRSGALITARQAVEDHGRPVFAVPGRVDNPQSAGPHKLIREGAVLTTCLEDIFHGLDPLPQDAVEPGLFAASFAEMLAEPGEPAGETDETAEAEASEPRAEADAHHPPADAPRLAGLSDRQRSILLEMGNDPAAIDLLMERTALPAQVVLQELTFLSLKGRVKRVDGQTYVRQPQAGAARMNVRYDMVACYVIRRAADGTGHEFLLLRRAAGEFMAGAWAVVRGTLEHGETASVAALRELREETGLSPREFYQLDTVDVFYLAAGDTIWHCPGFCAVVDREAEITLNEEHDAFRWTPREQIEAEVLWPGERNQLAELCRAILDDSPAKPYLRVPL